MKVLRLIERIAHWFALLLGVVAIVAIGVIIVRIPGMVISRSRRW